MWGQKFCSKPNWVKGLLPKTKHGVRGKKVDSVTPLKCIGSYTKDGGEADT